MRSVTFEWNHAVFEVQTGTVATGVDALYIANNLFEGARTPREWRHDLEYANFIAAVRLKSGDPGFTMPTVDDALDTIRVFYEPFEALPMAFFNALRVAQGELNTPINEKTLAPAIDPNAAASAATDEHGTSSFAPLTDNSSASLAAG